MQYSVAVLISLIDNFSASMAKLNSSLMGASSYAKTFHDKMGEIHQKWNTGMQMLMVGEALAAPIIHATKAASCE